MHAVGTRSQRQAWPGTGHQWVGAALVGLGLSVSDRAERAARTGRYVLPLATLIEVLEVYCRRCRVAYTPSAATEPCTAQVVEAG
jgi:hypothetical protein